MNPLDHLEFSYLGDDQFLWEYLSNDFGLSKAKFKKIAPELKQLILKKGKPYSIPIDLVNHTLVSPVYSGPHVEVIFEDQHILALSKPSGVHGHSLRYHDTTSLHAWLRSSGHTQPLEVQKSTPERGLLWRLDQYTSGLVVFAKNQATWDELFQTKKRKYYLCLCEGLVPERFDWSNQLVAKTKYVQCLEGEQYRIQGHRISSSAERSVCLVELYEGHRHQIRSQMAGNGHVIVGDKLYGGSEGELMLHALHYDIGKRYRLTDRSLRRFEAFLDLSGLFEVLCDKAGLSHIS